MEKKTPSLPTELNPASPLARRISLQTSKTALERVEQGMRQWYYWQSGVLFPYGTWNDPLISYYGGLTKNQMYFMLVPVDLVLACRRHHLRQIAQHVLGTDCQEHILAYCMQAEEECLRDWNPRPHAFFEADAQARQVAYWLEFQQEVKKTIPVSERS